ncbi:hypothetical protein O6H91_04G027900 [Diphasiastrum complanatum]|uniref:Uncharacterized protein n=1 Tax=Diphasiastrum complanatum TaxID=34168 RepID=A0ACC2DVA2_DIPCM|nr:hypothetical protein O6H91_04G027900 [Diphasiastrum complanatum]
MAVSAGCIWIAVNCLLLLVSASALQSVPEERIQLSEHTVPELETVGSARHLLQAKIPCPIDMANLNYTPCISICKAPNFPKVPCCEGFKAVVCPIVLYFNNASTDCPDEFFSYLNLYGSFPGGLFNDYCVEGVQGLACPLVPAPSPSHGVQKSRLSATYLLSLIGGFGMSYFIQLSFT